MTEETLAAILEAADEGLVVFDREGRCTLAGRRLGELFGVDVTTLLGGPEADVIELLASACEEPESFKELAQAGGGPVQQSGEIELKRPTLRTVRFRSTPILGPSGSMGWVGLARDVTRERSAERRSHQLLQRLEQITATDALTQLPNRRRFGEELDREHGRAARAWDSYAVLRIDVDGLKTINDELGQPRGDEVLERIAERLRDGRREYDLLARFAGDEFIVLIPGADAHGAKVVCQRMANAVAKTPIELGEPRTVTVSIGAAVWIPPSGESGQDVVARAGTALATAKTRGTSEMEIDAPEPSKDSPQRPASKPPSRR
ncbi:MAG: sensor domain-containing diguanylate cyclase [Polyangiales bacterium]